MFLKFIFLFSLYDSPLYIVGGSYTILRGFTLIVDAQNLDKLRSNLELTTIPFRNVELNLEQTSRLKEIKNTFKKIKFSIENLKVYNAKFKSFEEFCDIVGNITTIRSLSFEKCQIDYLKNEALPELTSLKAITFNKCNDNMFRVFIRQTSIKKFTIINLDWTWNGFPHEVFNELAKKSEKIDELILKGSGTGSYFDSDEFPYKLVKLDTTMITFHWYVGIRSERTGFLKSQLDYLKDLTIHELPNDFDGGRVLRYILNDMNLDEFHFGKISLIKNGKRQDVKEFEASEIQIQSAFELIRQYPCK